MIKNIKDIFSYLFTVIFCIPICLFTIFVYFILTLSYTIINKIYNYLLNIGRKNERQ